MSKQKHIATYAIYGRVSGRRVATGYIYKPEEIDPIAATLTAHGQPFHLRWRNEACRTQPAPDAPVERFDDGTLGGTTK